MFFFLTLPRVLEVSNCSFLPDRLDVFEVSFLLARSVVSPPSAVDALDSAEGSKMITRQIKLREAGLFKSLKNLKKPQQKNYFTYHN